MPKANISPLFGKELAKLLDKHHPHWHAVEECESQDSALRNGTVYDGLLFGVSRRSLQRWIRGEVRPQPERLRVFLEHARFHEDEIVSLYDLYHAPYLSKSAAEQVPDDRTYMRAMYAILGSIVGLALSQHSAAMIDGVLTKLSETVDNEVHEGLQARLRHFLRLMQVQVYRSLGDAEQAQQLVDTLPNYYTDIRDDPILTGYTLHVEGNNSLWVHGDTHHALDQLRSATNTFRQEDNAVSNHAALADQSMAHLYLGQLAAANTKLKTALKWAKTHNDSRMEVSVTGYMVLLHLMQGRLESALNLAGSHLYLAESEGSVAQLANGHGNRGTVYAAMGDYEKACADYQVDIDARERDHLFRANAYALKAMALSELGRCDEGHALAQRALDIADANHYPLLRILALRALADCSGSNVQRLSLLNEVLAMTEARDMRMHQASLHLALKQALKDPAQQAYHDAQVRALLRESGAWAWLSAYEAGTVQRLPII